MFSFADDTKIGGRACHNEDILLLGQDIDK